MFDGLTAEELGGLIKLLTRLGQNEVDALLRLTGKVVVEPKAEPLPAPAHGYIEHYTTPVWCSAIPSFDAQLDAVAKPTVATSADAQDTSTQVETVTQDPAPPTWVDLTTLAKRLNTNGAALRLRLRDNFMLDDLRKQLPSKAWVYNLERTLAAVEVLDSTVQERRNSRGQPSTLFGQARKRSNGQYVAGDGRTKQPDMIDTANWLPLDVVEARTGVNLTTVYSRLKNAKLRDSSRHWVGKARQYVYDPEKLRLVLTPEEAAGLDHAAAK